MNGFATKRTFAFLTGVLTMLCCTREMAAVAEAAVRDSFAEIASQRVTERQAVLVEPQPPKLPDTKLPWPAEAQPFAPGEKLDTVAELQAELARQRERYAPFLADLAPKMDVTRLVVPIESFDWRVETETDRKDFAGTLAGQGQWQRVRIPHYGAPLGRAVTYYRTTFPVTQAMLDRGAVFVRFKGVDYKAHVFVNGSFLGSHEGFFAPFELDFTPQARVGENVLVVKVENDFIHLGSRTQEDKTLFQGEKIYAASGLGYDDPAVGWHHCPPGMGIYQDVTIEARPRVHLHDLFVRPLPEQSRAEAWIEVVSCDVAPTNAVLELSVFGQNFSGTVFTGRRSNGRTVQMAGAGDVAQQPEDNSRLWRGVNYLRVSFDLPQFRAWELESPWLYQLQVKLLDASGRVLDAQHCQFGMRSFRMDTANEPKGRMFLNGRPIRLRGANTMGFEQQDVLRKNFDQLRDDILLAKICHMNFLRLTQRPVQPDVYAFCDRLGLMTQTDLPLFGVLRRSQFAEAVRQAGEMERLIRAHPCNVMVSYINEPFPNGRNEPHRHLTRPELEGFFVAAGQAVLLANPDRVIKAVDGDYDPPGPGLPDNHCYPGWYNGHGVDLGKLDQGYWQRVKPGWVYGCGEFGSEGLDPVNTMRRYYPKSWLPASAGEERDWTPGRIVDAQSGRFHYLWFDTQHSLADWVRASQAHQAWVTRIMTEAFRRDRNMSSFALHLFIDAFPAGWMKTIMDVDRQPKPAYFAYRDALEPLSANLHSARRAFFSGETVRVAAWLCNDTAAPLTGAKLRYQIEVGNRVVQCGVGPAAVPACDSAFQGWLEFPAPPVSQRTSMTVRLAAFSSDGRRWHDTALALDLFGPPPPPVAQRVRVIGSRSGKAAKLAAELNLEAGFDGDVPPEGVILIDDPKAFAAAGTDVAAAVRAGARAVFLELPAGNHQIAGDSITVERCGMNPRHFVSRATGHPLVDGFAPDDFKFWYDAAAGGVRPLLSTVFKAAGWKPVLLSGQGDWAGNWGPALAVAEKPDGRGSWFLCQLQIPGRTTGNPVALLFARRLLLK
jgi:hypothetical protein